MPRKTPPNQKVIMLCDGMTPEQVTALMPASLDIADVLKHRDKSFRHIFPDNVLSTNLGARRILTRAIVDIFAFFDIAVVQKNERPDGTFIIKYKDPDLHC